MYVDVRPGQQVIVVYVSSVPQVAMPAAMMPVRVGICSMVSGYPSEHGTDPNRNTPAAPIANCRADRPTDYTPHDGASYTLALMRVSLNGWTQRHDCDRNQNSYCTSDHDRNPLSMVLRTILARHYWFNRFK